MPLDFGSNKTIVPAVKTRKVVATRIIIDIPHHRSAGSETGPLVDDANGVSPGGTGYVETFGPDVTWAALDPVEPAAESRFIRVEFMDETGRTYGATISVGEAAQAGVDVVGLDSALKTAVYNDVFVAKAKLPLGGQVV
ncbi:MAG: hypothetical protein IIA53_09540 [Chloroflexi bacterium]|nr:hypothetical protein [Chloroflexota bacterium]